MLKEYKEANVTERGRAVKGRKKGIQKRIRESWDKNCRKHRAQHTYQVGRLL